MENQKNDHSPLMNEKLESSVAELLRKANDDFSELDDYLSEHEDEYDGDLWDFAFREAIRQGNFAYVEANIEDVELNDEMGLSTYLNETDDACMRELLFDNGARASMEDYADYSFATDTVNWSIISFDPDLQQEAFEKYLEVHGLTEEDAIRFLEEGIDEAQEAKEEEEEYSFEDDMATLGVEAEDGQISFRDMSWADGGDAAKELLEALGWDCQFEGQRWKLETLGVYFIE